MPKMVRVYFRVTSEQNARLITAAASSGRTQPDIVRSGVEELLSNPIDLARDKSGRSKHAKRKAPRQPRAQSRRIGR